MSKKLEGQWYQFHSRTISADGSVREAGLIPRSDDYNDYQRNLKSVIQVKFETPLKNIMGTETIRGEIVVGEFRVYDVKRPKQ